MRSLFVLLFLTNIANAEPVHLTEAGIKIRAKLLDTHISHVVGKTQLGLYGLRDLLSKNIIPQDQLQELLKQKIQEIGHIRAILFLNSEGIIVGDSTRDTVSPIDLSSRKYFIEAKNDVDRQMRIGDVLKGRQSGFPFIPITVPVYSQNSFVGLLVAILTPEELLVIEREARCSICLSIVTKSDGTLLQRFPNVDGLGAFLSSFSDGSRASSGYSVMDTGKQRAKVAWIKNENFPIRSFFLEFIQE